MINDILARSTNGQPTPEVGMGVTFLSFSDRSAGTICEVIRPDLIGVKPDHAKVVNGSTQDGSAVWEHSPNPDTTTIYYRFDDGRWRSVYKNGNRWCITGNISGLIIGRRDHYRDPSF